MNFAVRIRDTASSIRVIGTRVSATTEARMVSKAAEYDGSMNMSTPALTEVATCELGEPRAGDHTEEWYQLSNGAWAAQRYLGTVRRAAYCK